MKRVIAFKEPDLLKGDPGLCAARLAYDQREVAEELALIDLLHDDSASDVATVKHAHRIHL
jgi:hypothetical protein